MSRHGHSGIRHINRSGRDSNYYLYEEPELFLVEDSDTGALSTAPKVGTVMRTNPLPPGQYWVDVFGVNIPVAQNWFKAMSNLGVHVDATQHFEATEVPQVRDWYKFTYTQYAGTPVIWDTTLGYPTVADSSITTSADTSSTPPLPLGPLDEAADWLNGLEQKLGGSLGAAAQVVPYVVVGGALIGGYLLFKESGLFGKAVSSVRRFRKSRSPRSR